MGTGREFSKLFSDIVCEQARQYMNSYPPRCNTPFQAVCERLTRGEVLHEDTLGEYSDILCYRLSMNKLVTEMKDYLGLRIADVHLFDVFSWVEKTTESMHPKGIRKEIAPWTRYTNIISMVDKAHIFDPPVGNQGAFYCKPSVYLAIAFHDSGRSMAQIASDIEKLVGFSSNRVNRPTEQASLSVGEDISSGFRLACLGSFANIVAEQARRYLKSFPGNDASGSNPQHGWFRLIAGGETTDRDHLEVLFDELCYRNALTRVATICKDLLQLPIEDAHLFDTWAWQQEQEPNEQWDRYSKIRHAIHDAAVFGHPEPHQGFFFGKPTEYLAIAFVKSGRPMEQVLAEIKKIRIRRFPTLIFTLIKTDILGFG